MSWLIAITIVVQLEHPHGYIRQFKIPGSMTDCCGSIDCLPIAEKNADSVEVGDSLYLEKVGTWKAGYVEVKGIFPSPPDGNSWFCHTGCLFRPFKMG